jgi:ABC-type dipeptide/oligopeptide/nickel transport system ATPase component
MAKIVHICGTSGSGKTTLIRAFMKILNFKPEFTEGMKSPIGYIGGRVFIPGSYEVLTASGCDTIKSVELNYTVVREVFECGLDVIYEGLFMMNHTRGLELWEQTRALEVIRLTTSIEDCMKAVRDRRVATGNDRKEGTTFEKNLIGHDTRATNYCEKLRQAGCTIHQVSREKALDKLLDILEITA